MHVLCTHCINSFLACPAVPPTLYLQPYLKFHNPRTFEDMNKPVPNFKKFGLKAGQQHIAAAAASPTLSCRLGVVQGLSSGMITCSFTSKLASGQAVACPVPHE